MKSVPKRAILYTVFILVIVALASGTMVVTAWQTQSTLPIPGGHTPIISAGPKESPAALWLESYLRAVRQRGTIEEFSIESEEEQEQDALGRAVMLISFTVTPKPLPLADSGKLWQGEPLDDGRIRCVWVLCMEKEALENGESQYHCVFQQEAADYVRGKREEEEFLWEHVNEIPPEPKEYTYRIQGGVCAVSLDHGGTWRDVPVPIEELSAGYAFQNRLQADSYRITPEKIALLYGANDLSIVYSDDGGRTWQTTKIATELPGVRARFLSFADSQNGYAVVAHGRVMSQEGTAIYRTTDGGRTWRHTGQSPRTRILNDAAFISENVGFLCYPGVHLEGDADLTDEARRELKANLFRTADGGESFAPSYWPEAEDWDFIIPFSKVFNTPQAPCRTDGTLVLLVGQGENGDYEGGRLCARYRSDDEGETWQYVDLYEPEKPWEPG